MLQVICGIILFYLIFVYLLRDGYPIKDSGGYYYIHGSLKDGYFKATAIEFYGAKIHA